MGIVLSLIISSLFTLAIPMVIQRIIDDGIVSENSKYILSGSIIMIFIAMLGALFSFFQNYLASIGSQNIAFDIRNRLYKKIHDLSFGYHDQAQTGQLLTRATNDVDHVQNFIGRGLVMLLTAVFMLIGSLILLFSLDWQLALMMLIILPLITAILARFATKARPIFTEVQLYLSKLNTVLQENLEGVRVVKAFAREEFERERFGAANLDLTNKNIQVGKMFSMAFPLVFLIANLGTLGVVWLGGLQVLNGKLTIGELVAFQNYLFMVTFPMLMLGMIIALISQASASSERIFEILDAQSEVIEKPAASDMVQILGRVAFINVWFRYFGDENKSRIQEISQPRYIKPGKARLLARSEKTVDGNRGDWVLQDVSFVVEPGQVVALLGATGSGKSTIINLIPRFYDVSRGQITIDGVDIRDVTLNSLRSQIGIVMQETTLFTGSIHENIAYGRPDAPIEEVISAAQTAGAHNFIFEFPDGYATMVGERGVNLSGGQKQRIAIARALLMNPRILILDDSTSSVDVETEFYIQQALSKLMFGRTTFIIAQRISTVLGAHKILVLDEGHIVAQGTHSELMLDSPIYAEIFGSQLIDNSETQSRIVINQTLDEVKGSI